MIQVFEWIWFTPPTLFLIVAFLYALSEGEWPVDNWYEFPLIIIGCYLLWPFVIIVGIHESYQEYKIDQEYIRNEIEHSRIWWE